MEETEMSFEVAAGDLLQASAVLVAATAVLLEIRKERKLRRKEYADRIRRATAVVIAKLDRRKQLALQLFDDLQIAATDADQMIVNTGDIIATRDFFWRSAMEARHAILKQKAAEEVEIAYSDLYGYDTNIQGLFAGAVELLRKVELAVHIKVLNRTQARILLLQEVATEDLVSSRLGNELRLALAEARHDADTYMELVLRAFRDGLEPVINADDENLAERELQVPGPSYLPDVTETLEGLLSEGVRGGGSSCRAVFEHVSETGQVQPADPWLLGLQFPEGTGKQAAA
jgi:hypothetical protein